MPRRVEFIAKSLSLQAFVVAGLVMGGAIAAQAALSRVLPGAPPYIIVFPAVLLVGLFCGPVAASLAVVSAAVAAAFLWLPDAKTATGVSLGLFVAASGAIVWATSRFRGQLNRMGIANAALALAQDVGGMGSFEYDLRTGRIDASSGAYRLHGLPEDGRQNAPEDWLRGVDPRDEALARESLRAAVEGGGMAAYSYRVSDGAGGLRWINARGRVVSAGGERRLVCALVDATEQISTQNALERERERLRLALEAGSLAVWEFDPQTEMATIDSRYAATTGLDMNIVSSAREQIGRSIHPDDRGRVAAEHDAAVAGGGEYRIEYRIIDRAQRVRWVVSKGMMLKGDASQPPILVGIIQDVTDQRLREDHLREVAATRELLIREADHRIKNSLQMVTSLLRLQLRGKDDSPLADALTGAIARVQAIAASHLALQGSEDLRTVDLRFVLEELCAHFSPFHPAGTLVCQIEESLVLDADRAIRMGLVVNELITNALRHGFPMGRTGTVTVEAKTQENDVVVCVRDTGVGTTSSSGREGLGSRIVRTLTSQIGARLETESRPDVGTTVTLRLPLKASTETVDGARAEP